MPKSKRHKHFPREKSALKVWLRDRRVGLYIKKQALQEIARTRPTAILEYLLKHHVDMTLRSEIMELLQECHPGSSVLMDQLLMDLSSLHHKRMHRALTFLTQALTRYQTHKQELDAGERTRLTAADVSFEAALRRNGYLVVRAATLPQPYWQRNPMTSRVRAFGRDLVSCLGEGALSALHQCLSSPYDRTFRTAVRCISCIESGDKQEILETIASHARSPFDDERVQGVYGLGWMGAEAQDYISEVMLLWTQQASLANPDERIVYLVAMARMLPHDERLLDIFRREFQRAQEPFLSFARRQRRWLNATAALALSKEAAAPLLLLMLDSLPKRTLTTMRMACLVIERCGVQTKEVEVFLGEVMALGDKEDVSFACKAYVECGYVKDEQGLLSILQDEKIPVTVKLQIARACDWLLERPGNVFLQIETKDQELQQVQLDVLMESLMGVLDVHLRRWQAHYEGVLYEVA